MFDPMMLQSGAKTGAMDMDTVEALSKALSAGYGTDVAQLSGGGALRIQSLDTVLQATIQENDHFVLFKKLQKTKPTATVDEWTEQDKVGGFLGGSTNTESGNIRSATGSYARQVGMVKFLMQRREVTLVQSLQKTIADSEAIEYSNGALAILSDVEYLLFEGDELTSPTEFSGIKAQIQLGVNQGKIDGGNVISMDGEPLVNMKPINLASAQIRRYGNFGRATDIFWNQDVQADMDNNLDPAFRVNLTNVGEGGLKLGAPVIGIRTSGGNIVANEDVFIRSDRMKQPFEIQYPTVAAENVGMKPAAVTADATASAVDSMFTAARAGNYYYLVAGLNAQGQSTGLVSAQVAVAAGKKVVLSITRSVGQQETGYAIYRSRQNGGASIPGSDVDEGSDFREMVRIPVQGATTTWTDLNRDIPGTTEAYILNLSSGAHAITFRQLLPMMKFPLYPTAAAIIPWAQLFFGFLRITKRKHHVVIKNILPTGQGWRPHAD